MKTRACSCWVPRERPKSRRASLRRTAITRCSNSKTPEWHKVCYNCDTEHARDKIKAALKLKSSRKHSASNDPNRQLRVVLKATLTISAQNLCREGDAEERVVGEEKDDNQQYGGDLPRVNRAKGNCITAQL